MYRYIYSPVKKQILYFHVPVRDLYSILVTFFIRFRLVLSDHSSNSHTARHK